MDDRLRVRVVPPIQVGRVYRIGIAGSVVCGLVTGWLFPALRYDGVLMGNDGMVGSRVSWDVISWVDSWRGLIFVPCGLLALLAGWWLATHCQRRRRGFLIATTVVTVCIWSLIWFYELFASTFADVGYFIGETTLLGGIVSIVIGAFGGLLYLLLPFIVGQFRYQVIEQDGSRCGACGYILIGLAAGACCPECGVDPAANAVRGGRRIRLARFIGNRSGVVLAVAMVLFGVVSAGPLLQARSAGNLLRQLEPAGVSCEPMVGAIVAIGRRGGVFVSNGFFYFLDDEEQHTITVYTHPAEGEWSGGVQIRLGFSQVTTARDLLPEDLNPMILCNVDERQTKAMIASGIPDCLVARLQAEAEASGAVRDSSLGTAAFRLPVEVDVSDCFE